MVVLLQVGCTLLLSRQSGPRPLTSRPGFRLRNGTAYGCADHLHTIACWLV